MLGPEPPLYSLLTHPTYQAPTLGSVPAEVMDCLDLRFSCGNKTVYYVQVYLYFHGTMA